VDPSFDRRSRTLRINRVALEPGARFTAAARAAVTELATFVGAEETVYPS